MPLVLAIRLTVSDCLFSIPDLSFSGDYNERPNVLLINSFFLELSSKRTNQSILKEINPEYSLEGLMLKLKLQYFGHLMRRTDSLEKTLILGKIEGKRRRGWQRMRWLDAITDSIDTEFEQTLTVKEREAWHAVVHGVTKSQTQLN